MGLVDIFGKIVHSVLFIAPIVCWFVAMYSICDHSSAEFTRIGHSKGGWLAANLLLGPLGSFFYLAIARPAFKRMPSKTENSFTADAPQQVNADPYPAESTAAGVGREGATDPYFPEFDRNVP